ncbi:UvrD-helicase domain-containing protein [Flavobacterium psychrophilum]|uniref:UvrD-helicase domain-containing protein n=1 Tax=Flavobacterium psychrophilum TaxID=96345 RepID=UPI00090455EF|nr:UvrD-helicase domain-containing protein [Flavobacterium psychrophilum]EKT4499457.1 UvrD-helicase domain-containing protein [Flavobacterium psychrophilum]ELM3649760.1 UvrD-helicase domain-containing protein [Flavobacterium psychrophilum]ELM3671076.1 UvrD-helicase domain-containing protein [Flavobacterium psychrophilum]ELM3726345.1 UvrD-helicase domain-containing protein [Flavobacterium psychrophilum]ELY1979031.1 UvrD-helicase domain-containing protein [Flavobacterium psychrophilum]
MVFIFITVVILVVALIIYFEKQARLKREELERKRIEAEELRLKKIAELAELHKNQKSKLNPIFSKIDDYNKSLSFFIESPKFISNYDLYKFKDIHNPLSKKLNTLEYKHLPNFEKEIKTINQFISNFNSLESSIQKRNTEYVIKELKTSDNILSDIEGKSLDAQQRKAVVIDEDNNLIIAGAGSGKTTTIAGKVKYLTERLNVDKSKILLISFTRKSAEEMSDRIRNKMKIDLPVKTFHKLGLDIIAESTNEKPSIFSLSPKEITELIASFIKNEKNSESYSNKLLDFLAYFLKPYKSLEEFKTDGEHNDYLKEQKLEGYKIIHTTTKDGVEIKYRERFKSQEEVLIANFLFRNQIEYKYEEKYQYKTASKMFGQYKPDFYLPEYDIYIEHFGIDKNGKVPDWFKGDETKTAQEKYSEGIEWKKAEHLANKTTLIQTYSWEQKEGNLIKNLTDKLTTQNVTLNPLSDDDLWKYLAENIPEDIDVFTQLINTFLVLFKSNNEKIKTLASKAIKDDDKRATYFLEIFEPIYINYENYLKEKEEIDFSDMINIATKTITTNQYTSDYDYIIIDEFQDISKSRYQLIKALLDQKPSTKLFCVGDDWQSIYRFAGSDIGIFTGFEEYFKTSTLKDFNRKTNSSIIEQTYRFDNKLIEVSSNFILKNPNQIVKTLKSNKQSDVEAIKFHKYSDPEKKGANQHIALDKAIKEIIKNNPESKTSILFLGRYEFDYKALTKLNYINIRYDNKNRPYKINYVNNDLLELNFMTVHTSKGLEADYVIILNGNSGTFGFPSEISDDPLLNFLLSKADQFPNGEERRLFYVALTRAKKHVHILSSIENSSKFVDEIKENEPITAIKCDWCDNGKLIERKGPYGYFYSCNNSYYCNYTRKINTEDFTTLAKNFTDNKDFEKAIEYSKKSLEVDNSNATVHFNLARAYEQNKQFQEAITHYNNSININGNNAYSYYRRAYTFFQLKEYEKAITDWLIFNNLKPNASSVNSWLSAAYFATNHIIKALESIDAEIKTNPNNDIAIKLKNNYLVRLRDKYNTKESAVRSTELKTIKGYIQLAIDFEINIKFNYHKNIQFEGGLQSLRTIKPTGFKTMGQFDSVCVSGYCYMRKEERTFNLDRISDLVMNPKTIEFWSEE